MYLYLRVKGSFFKKMKIFFIYRVMKYQTIREFEGFRWWVFGDILKFDRYYCAFESFVDEFVNPLNFISWNIESHSHLFSHT